MTRDAVKVGWRCATWLLVCPRRNPGSRPHSPRTSIPWQARRRSLLAPARQSQTLLPLAALACAAAAAMTPQTMRLAAQQPAGHRAPRQLRHRPPPATSLRPAAQRLPGRQAAAVIRPHRQQIMASSVGDSSTSWLDDGIAARPPVNPSPHLFSPDLAPVPAAKRSWSGWDMAALWIGLVVSISSW